MREIKFRAWDNAVQMMVTPDAFNALVEGKKVAGQHPPVVEEYEVESEVQTGSFDGLIVKNIPVYSTITETLQREIVQPVEFMQGNPFVANELTVMQYTGLKDKNGVEIYEGDILSSPSMPDSPVEFQRGSFNAVYADGSHDEWEAPLWRYSVEVIGNIYENSELLNGNKE